MTTAGSYTETFVEVADVRLQLRQGGTGEPLLVLHGELGVPGWLRAYELLAEHFTVYVPSLPGFGQSARPDWIISVRDLAAWVTSVLSALSKMCGWAIYCTVMVCMVTPCGLINEVVMLWHIGFFGRCGVGRFGHGLGGTNHFYP